MMSYLGDVHRARSFEAVGGVPRQPDGTDGRSAAGIETARPMAAALPGKIDRAAIFAARRASLQKPSAPDTTDEKENSPSARSGSEGNKFFANLAPSVFARRKAGV